MTQPNDTNISEQIRRDVHRIDAQLDRFLEHRLEQDAELIRQHGGTEQEVANMVAIKRSDYEQAKHQALATVISFVMDVPMVGTPSRELH